MLATIDHSGELVDSGFVVWVLVQMEELAQTKMLRESDAINLCCVHDNFF